MSLNRFERRVFAVVAGCYALSVCTIIAAGIISASMYPVHFDWAYTVMSALASQKHNPEGAAYFAFGFVGSLLLLWPSITWIALDRSASGRLSRIGVRALRLGILSGALLGVERLVFLSFSDSIHKAHEVLALLCFLNLYAGVLFIYFHRLRRRTDSRWPAVLIFAPLLAIGLNQIGLYFGQRDLGWVDTSWREKGIPFWMSFAFWQWLAALTLWIGIGHLCLSARPARRA